MVGRMAAGLEANGVEVDRRAFKSIGAYGDCTCPA